MEITKYSISAIGLHKKIALVADVHEKIPKDLMNSLQEEKPDIIAVVGDLCEGHLYCNSKNKKQDQIIFFLKQCSSLAPTYYSKGNHEWMYNERDIEIVKSTGCTFLDNEWCNYDENICIGGMSSTIDYEKRLFLPRYNELKTEWLEKFNNQKKYKILLCHHPEYYVDYLKNLDINLILSGHAHGGQIRIRGKGLWAPGQGFFPKYVQGVIDDKLIISRGLANTLPIIPRLGNTIELVYVELI